MAIKSILIANAEMVQAILGGRKTCIRQIIKGYIPQNAQFGYSAFTPDGQISCWAPHTAHAWASPSPGTGSARFPGSGPAY